MADPTTKSRMNPNDMLNLAGTIIAAYVSKNPLPAGELPAMIKSVHSTLCALVATTGDEVAIGQKPAVSIKKSVAADYVICLEDGQKLKMLKRYLRSKYNLSPEEYRSKWGLPRDYPMVAPNYSARRSEFAKKIGLGRTKPQTPSKRRRRA